MRPWPEQIDELFTAGQYSDALALLVTVEGTLLPDKVGSMLIGLLQFHFMGPWEF